MDRLGLVRWVSYQQTWRSRRLEPLERRLAVIENRSAEHQVEALARAVESAIDGVLLIHKGRGMSSEMLNRLSDA